VTRKQKSSARTWYTVAIFVAGVIIVCVSVALLFKKPAAIANFVECEKAGGTILTTYPEQCTIGGETFTNTAGQHSGDNQVYVGLAESAALEKASAASTPARVVERDGEQLPVTMDYVLGRLNFSVKEGVVYKVTIEGQTVN